MSRYEAAKEILTKISKDADDLGENYNEATARFQLIDRILTDVLCWNRTGISVEKHERGEYTDYECGAPAQLIVEAKRASIGFELPVATSANLLKLETLIESSSSFREAIQQAIDYCKNRNIPYGAVSNGRQWVFFLGARTDAIDSLKGKCIVYPTLSNMAERFRELWDLVTPEAIEEGSLGTLLRRDALPPPPSKLSARLPGYPGFKNRNPIATELQILGGLFIDDLPVSAQLEEEFLKTAYCQSGAISQYALVSKELLRTRYTTFFESQAGVAVSPATSKKGTNPQLTTDVLAAALSKRPILLVGDVGVGKTTFVRHLIRVDAKEELSKALVLYIDYGTKPALSTELKGYTVSEIVRQLRVEQDVDIYERQFVRGVYNQRILDFGRGIYADLKGLDDNRFKIKEIEFLESLTSNVEEHVRLSLEHVSKGQKRQIVAFFDNVDQRPTAFQEEVFLIASSVAANWPVSAFVSLRPETFALSRARGALAAYQPRVFTIDPPRIDLVIKKRLEFALRQLKGAGTLPGLPEGTSIQSDNLEHYLSMLIDAFESRKDIIEFIDNMCSGSVRQALIYVGSFVGSGHVDSGKILGAIKRQGKYHLPLHEFLRAVIHKDAEYYDPTDSPIINIFDLSSDDSHEHFAALVLLDYVERSGQTGGSHGFVERRSVLEFLQQSGFRVEQSLSALRRVFDKGLVISPEGLKDEASSRVRVTTAGAYVRKRLCYFFSYLDAIIVDTPIIAPKYRQQIQDVRTLEERLSRTEIFLDYLDDCWGRSQLLHEKFDWPSLAGAARSQIQEIREHRAKSGHA